MEARKFHVHDKVTQNLHARRAAVGTLIVTGFERSVRVQHNRVGMANDIRVSLRQHFDVVACRSQPVLELGEGLGREAGLAARHHCARFCTGDGGREQIAKPHASAAGACRLQRQLPAGDSARHG